MIRATGISSLVQFPQIFILSADHVSLVRALGPALRQLCIFDYVLRHLLIPHNSLAIADGLGDCLRFICMISLYTASSSYASHVQYMTGSRSSLVLGPVNQSRPLAKYQKMDSLSKRQFGAQLSLGFARFRQNSLLFQHCLRRTWSRHQVHV